jgi:hypothetical protein
MYSYIAGKQLCITWEERIKSKAKVGAFNVELIAYCSTCSNIFKKQYNEVLFTTKKLHFDDKRNIWKRTYKIQMFAVEFIGSSYF